MSDFDYTRDVFRPIEQRMIAAAQARKKAAPQLDAILVERLAEAMLDAKAGASGAIDSAEQRRRTIMMAEWVIARLPFHDLALIHHSDGRTQEERESRYRRWLRREG